MWIQQTEIRNDNATMSRSTEGKAAKKRHYKQGSKVDEGASKCGNALVAQQSGAKIEGKKVDELTRSAKLRLL